MKNEDVERYLINVLKNTPKIVKDNLTYNNQILNKASTSSPPIHLMPTPFRWKTMAWPLSCVR